MALLMFKFPYLNHPFCLKRCSSIFYTEWCEGVIRITAGVAFALLHATTCDDEVKHIQYIALSVDTCANSKRTFQRQQKSPFPLPEPSDSQWCGSSRIQFRCITLLMLLKWPQRLSAGREVKQDHLLLFLEKLPAWLIHRQRPFVSHLQCKTHVKQDAAHTSHVCVIWWIRSGYYRNRRWRDCLQAVLGLLFFFTVRTFSTTLNSRVLDMNKHLHKQFTCLHLKPI